MRQRFICWNGAIPSTGPQVRVTLTNAQKTQLQITAGSATQLELIEWGCSMDGLSAATPVQVELLTTAGIAGTGMTAVTPSKFGDPNAPASQATAGFTPTAEGTIVTVRMFESVLVPPTTSYVKQFPLGERPIVDVSTVVRVRTNTPAGVTPGFLCWLIWAE